MATKVKLLILEGISTSLSPHILLLSEYVKAVCR